MNATTARRTKRPTRRTAAPATTTPQHHWTVAWWREARWSTRRVSLAVFTGTMVASNPKTINAIITWASTTAADWTATAQQMGLI